MKRFGLLLLCAVFCFTLVACESEAVKNTKSAIDAIGTVTLDSESAILKAENLYNSLSDSEKGDITNYRVLEAARSAYDDLKELDDNTIKNFEKLDASGANLFEDTSFDEWYESDDAAATLSIVLLLKGMTNDQVEISDYKLAQQYLCPVSAEGRIDIYAPYDGKIMGMRYWRDKKTAEIGTVETSLGIEDYVALLERHGVIDKSKKIKIESINKVLGAIN